MTYRNSRWHSYCDSSAKKRTKKTKKNRKKTVVQRAASFSGSLPTELLTYGRKLICFNYVIAQKSVKYSNLSQK